LGRGPYNLAQSLALSFIKGEILLPLNPTPITVNHHCHILFLFAHLLFLIPVSNSSVTMADVVVINLDDALVIIEKRGHICPRGSKNKSKIVAATSSSITMAKRHHGRPLGSKNKKLAGADASASIDPDVSLAQPILPQAFAENMFRFFAFDGAQCCEHQRLPSKFAEFMDGHKLHEAIL
jgi:hypothetical protein